ncbi:uroporphyrinogen decarboxylase family protein [Holophaga foetida]|uniref:uroporphyrinogen decarboxylase family protein n=1 Tax=Holophaga foetida TaxID=35839 RepID=UPI0002472A86|nr:uroporphyrinogen decarboxylase family protein [Holophaga foetida]
MHGKMPPTERLEATIALRPVDRIVCAPFINGYAASYAHISQIQFLNDFDLGLHCLDRLKAAYPGWDCNRGSYSFLGYGPLLKNRWFQKVVLPGEGGLAEDTQYQILEEELATQEELLSIRKKGFTRYMMAVTKRVRPKAGLIHYLLWERRYRKFFLREREAARHRGQSQYYGAASGIAFEMFSMTRSLEKFTQDVFRLGEDLLEILDIVDGTGLQATIDQCRESGNPRVFVSLTRCGPAFLSPKYFDRFVWPGLKKMALGLIDAGLTPIFHLDTNWDRVMEKFLELPKGKSIIETDGDTDLFRAKEILKDHTCLAGDLPAAMLAVGSPSEVETYCRRLIDEVGKGGGFIFSTGCMMPINARHENVKAMFDTLAKFGRYD